MFILKKLKNKRYEKSKQCRGKEILLVRRDKLTSTNAELKLTQ